MDRRTILTGFAIIGTAPIVLAQARTSFGASSTASSMNLIDARTAEQYYAGVIGRAELSLATSQIAVEKTSNKNAKEFAGFELGEAITVNSVLKDIGTKAPAMDEAATAMLEKIKTAPKGAEFDKAYIALQLENHEKLRDLADAYLHNSVASKDPAELQGRHLSSLMLAVFKEHVAICKRISGELAA